MHIEPPLSESEISAVSRRFVTSFSAAERRPVEFVEKGPAARSSSDSDYMISYRVLMDWINPVDVGRVAKR